MSVFCIICCIIVPIIPEEPNRTPIILLTPQLTPERSETPMTRPKPQARSFLFSGLSFTNRYNHRARSATPTQKPSVSKDPATPQVPPVICIVPIISIIEFLSFSLVSPLTAPLSHLLYFTRLRADDVVSHLLDLIVFSVLFGELGHVDRTLMMVDHFINERCIELIAAFPLQQIHHVFHREPHVIHRILVHHTLLDPASIHAHHPHHASRVVVHRVRRDEHTKRETDHSPD